MWRKRRFLLGWLAAAAVGCDSLLDVENPGSLAEEEILGADAAELWANGSLRKVQVGWDGMLSLLSVASDEARYGGRFGGFGDLDQGHLADRDNGQLGGAFESAAAAQWMSDEAIRVLARLDATDALGDDQRALLARAYLYGAIAYPTIADGLEDYAPSDRSEPGPALGSENMGSLYDRAVEYATAGLTIQSDGELGRNLMAARARARHAARVRRRIQPPPADVSGGGLVGDDAAAADALAALSQDGSDWRYRFRFAPEIVASWTAFDLNCPGELRVGQRYASLDARGLAEEVVLTDPIDNVPDPWLEELLLEEFPSAESCLAPDLTVFSAREMHLIVAEHALANGDLDTFSQHVNQVRSLEGLSPWTPESGVSARDLLVYERRSQLYLMGRRLADMYRFGIQSDTWVPGSAAVEFPGTLFPIPTSEIEANCRLNGSCG